jgi:hypothetical protein
LQDVATDGGDGRFALACALYDALSAATGGTLVAYNVAFEKKTMRELGRCGDVIAFVSCSCFV